MNVPVVIDIEAVEKLEEWGGKELVRKMIGLFLEHAPRRMDQIRGAVAGGTLEEAERGAHSLKSSAGNVGARRLQALAAEVEESALKGDGDGVSSLLAPLEEAYGDAESALSNLMTDRF